MSYIKLYFFIYSSFPRLLVKVINNKKCYLQIDQLCFVRNIFFSLEFFQLLSPSTLRPLRVTQLQFLWAFLSAVRVAPPSPLLCAHFSCAWSKTSFQNISCRIGDIRTVYPRRHGCDDADANPTIVYTFCHNMDTKTVVRRCAFVRGTAVPTHV